MAHNRTSETRGAVDNASRLVATIQAITTQAITTQADPRRLGANIQAITTQHMWSPWGLGLWGHGHTSTHERAVGRFPAMTTGASERLIPLQRMQNKHCTIHGRGRMHVTSLQHIYSIQATHI